MGKMNLEQACQMVTESPTWLIRESIIVVSAETPNGRSHHATKCVRLVIPTDGKADLRMKSRQTLP